MSRFSDKTKQEKEGIPSIKMRIGIHAGPVVVGTLGNDLRVEFKAVGDTVNLASRMEGLAKPGTTNVTEETLRFTEGLFRFEALGEQKIKGKEHPIKVYRVIAPSTRRTRFDVNAERGLTPFIGRERELEFLMDGFERSKSSLGQAFSIVAEAGVGKSRLLYEFRKTVANNDVTFLEGKCLSYGRGQAYHPVIDILKANFDIHENDGDLAIRGKVQRGLKTLGANQESTLPYLLELLSVKDSGIDKIPMSPEAKKDKIIEALKRIVLKGSEVRPLIMAFEDLHWADKSSEEIAKYILEVIADARVMLIFTYRPEFVHSWGVKSYHSQVNLNRLSNRESLRMIYHLLRTEEIVRGLEDLILKKTEGVPFFIEEFIGSFKDLKIIKRKNRKYYLTKDIQSISIPSTIHDIISAKVDSLPEVAKRILQTGSVIEREFSYELIKKATGILQDELSSNLSVLKDSELIYERGIYPQSTYIFKHAMTRDVVYDSILTKRKKQLHEKIGKSIEELYKENIDEYYGLLTEHFIAGKNYEKGAEYSKLTSKKAEKKASLNDAIIYAKKRILSLEKLPQTYEVEKRLIDARTTLGLYYIQINYHVEAKMTVDPIIDLALRYDYKERLSQIYTIIGTYNYLVEQDFPRAFEHLGEALKISEDTNNIVSLFFTNQFLGLALSLNCEFEKAFHCFEKALNINVEVNNLWGISAMKCMIGYFVYYFQGMTNLCHKTIDEAIRIAEDCGDIYPKAMSHINHGISCYVNGYLEDATKYLLRGVNLCERINLYFWNALAQSNLGDNYFELGEFQTSKNHYNKAARLVEPKSFIPYFMNLNKIGFERAKVMNHEKDIDLEAIYRYEKGNKVKLCEGWMQRYIGEILLNIDDHHMIEAGDWIHKAIESDGRNGMKWHLGRDYALYAELFKRKGDQSKAKENLNKAIEILSECGADGWVEKYEKELAAL